MFKKTKIQFAILMLFMVAWGCSTDEGNYNYHDINEIKATGIQKSYTAYSGEIFKLAPNLNPTMDDGSNPNRYTYEWVAINSALIPSLQKTIFATTKNLDGKLNLPPATYSIQYSVKDSVTGVTWAQPLFELNVVSSTYEGWLVIGDVAGKARLDMVSILPGISTPRIINDVLNFTGSALKLSGKAVDVSCFNWPLTTEMTYGIYVTASESGTARIDQNSFGWQQSQNLVYETLGGSFPANFGVDFMNSAWDGENFLYVKGNIYYFMRMFGIKYGLPQNKVDSETKTFYAAPFIAVNGGVFGGPVFYDQDERRFLSFNPWNGKCSLMPPVSSSSTVLDWNNTNSDLKYMTTSRYNFGENFAVLKDISTNKFNMLKFDGMLNQTYYKEILNAPDFDKATKFAVSPASGYLFYVAGNKLYEYDLGTQMAKLMVDKGANEITYINFDSQSKGFSQKLILGSYDGTNGKLEIYTVPPVNGDLILDNSYDGLCKIVDVAYRKR
jgi:hypothetical protein